MLEFCYIKFFAFFNGRMMQTFKTWGCYNFTMLIVLHVLSAGVYGVR